MESVATRITPGITKEGFLKENIPPSLFKAILKRHKEVLDGGLEYNEPSDVGSLVIYQKDYFLNKIILKFGFF